MVIAAGSLIGLAGLALLAWHGTVEWMYVGVSVTSAGTGLVLPVLSFLAAGAAHRKLGGDDGRARGCFRLGTDLGVRGGRLAVRRPGATQLCVVSSPTAADADVAASEGCTVGRYDRNAAVVSLAHRFRKRW